MYKDVDETRVGCFNEIMQIASEKEKNRKVFLFKS